MSAQTSAGEINPEIIYRSVRQEILDQKKCQFQMFGAALTVTAAILAYANSTKAAPLVYVVPVLINVLALTIILDKALSIQRMVGYLQLMESGLSPRRWMWEYHLNLFREIPPASVGSDAQRKHTYIRNIALMLLTLNLVSSALYFLGPEAVALRAAPSYQSLREIYGAIHLVVIVFNVVGGVVVGRRWWQLVHGDFTSRSIRARWIEVFAKSDQQPAI